MFAFVASWLGRLGAYFRQEETHGTSIDLEDESDSVQYQGQFDFSSDQDSASDQSTPHRQQSLSNVDPEEEHPFQGNHLNKHFPRSLSDIHRTIRYLDLATSCTLPAEVLKVILYYGDYDCLHFKASSNHQMNAISRSQHGPPARAYIETPPLDCVASTFTTNERSIPVGRIRSLHLKITGRDQGWASDPNTAAWSWFEIGKKRFASDSIHRGPVLLHNAIAGQDWEDYEFYFHMDDKVPQKHISEELRQWIGELGVEDRIVIVPMAKYGGWQCRVSKASIDIEVETWY